MKIGSKNNLRHQSHFTEHLMGAFGKSSRKSDLKHETSSFFDPVAQESHQFPPAAIHTKTNTRIENQRQLTTGDCCALPAPLLVEPNITKSSRKTESGSWTVSSMQDWDGVHGRNLQRENH
jgi:hypothetical protein